MAGLRLKSLNHVKNTPLVDFYSLLRPLSFCSNEGYAFKRLYYCWSEIALILGRTLLTRIERDAVVECKIRWRLRFKGNRNIKGVETWAASSTKSDSPVTIVDCYTGFGINLIHRTESIQMVVLERRR